MIYMIIYPEALLECVWRNGFSLSLIFDNILEERDFD